MINGTMNVIALPCELVWSIFVTRPLLYAFAIRPDPLSEGYLQFYAGFFFVSEVIPGYICNMDILSAEGENMGRVLPLVQYTEGQTLSVPAGRGSRIFKTIGT
jgi:hypothetical protein